MSRDDLAETFTHSATKAVKACIQKLTGQDCKPEVSRLNDAFVERGRRAGYPDQTMSARTQQEAVDIQQRLESERRQGLFVDHCKPTDCSCKRAQAAPPGTT